MTQADHRTQAAAGIHRISRLGMVNEYLVAEDDGLTLIDTGLAGTHRLILARARDLGMPIRRIALTHAHRDHRGSLDALAAAVPGVLVATINAPALLSARGSRRVLTAVLKSARPRIVSPCCSR